jgi:tetratricopeptide (TPR) repeat protein
MSNLKCAVVFAALVTMSGMFPDTAKAQVGHYGGFYYPIPGASYNPNYPPLTPDGSNVPAPNSYRPRSGGRRNLPAQPRNNNTDNLQVTSDYIASADLKYKKEDFQGALADLNQAIQIKPNDYTAHAYYMRGLVKNDKLGDRSGGIADVRQAARLLKNQKDDVKVYRSAIRQLKAWGVTE